MTEVPDFVDASSIPAGASGYINMVFELRLVSGYPDNTFQPNKNVTRAKMAAFLDRTNDGLLEESGAITVTGTIVNIDFPTVTDNVYKAIHLPVLQLQKHRIALYTLSVTVGKSMFTIVPVTVIAPDSSSRPSLVRSKKAAISARVTFLLGWNVLSG